MLLIKTNIRAPVLLNKLNLLQKKSLSARQASHFITFPQLI